MMNLGMWSFDPAGIGAPAATGAAAGEPPPQSAVQGGAPDDRSFGAHLDDSLVEPGEHGEKERQAAASGDLAVLLNLFLPVQPEVCGPPADPAPAVGDATEASVSAAELNVAATASSMATDADPIETRDRPTSAAVAPAAASIDAEAPSRAAPDSPETKKIDPDRSSGKSERMTRDVGEQAHAQRPAAHAAATAAPAERTGTTGNEGAAHQPPASDAVPATVTTFSPDGMPVQEPASVDRPALPGRPAASAHAQVLDTARSLSERGAESPGAPVQTDAPRAMVVPRVPSVPAEAADLLPMPAAAPFRSDRSEAPRNEASAEPAPSTSGTVLPARAFSSDERSGDEPQRENEDRILPYPPPAMAAAHEEGSRAPMSPLREAVVRPPSAPHADVVVPAALHAAATQQQAPPIALPDDMPMDAPRAPLLPETADSIVQSMRMQYQQGGGDAIVHIKPEHLGPVSISLRVENGAVSAVVNADNPEVAEWLRANEHVLREGLASSGLHLERFAVRRDGQTHDDARRSWKPPLAPERRRRALHPQSTFEVTV
jgi:flagellar hook-length control protein FliK